MKSQILSVALLFLSASTVFASPFPGNKQSKVVIDNLNQARRQTDPLTGQVGEVIKNLTGQKEAEKKIAYDQKMRTQEASKNSYSITLYLPGLIVINSSKSEGCSQNRRR